MHEDVVETWLIYHPIQALFVFQQLNCLTDVFLLYFEHNPSLELAYFFQSQFLYDVFDQQRDSSLAAHKQRVAQS